MPMRGGCGPAHTGTLCISIIILIIVIILIIMVGCGYNYNNYYNQPPPSRIQNPAAVAAAAYKYKMNGGVNRFAAAPIGALGGRATPDEFQNPLMHRNRNRFDDAPMV